MCSRGNQRSVYVVRLILGSGSLALGLFLTRERERDYLISLASSLQVCQRNLKPFSHSADAGRRNDDDNVRLKESQCLALRKRMIDYFFDSVFTWLMVSSIMNWMIRFVCRIEVFCLGSSFVKRKQNN